VVRVPGCRREMYWVSCEVRAEFIYVMYRKLRDFDLRVTALARPRRNCIVICRAVLSSERALQNYKPVTDKKEISRRKQTLVNSPRLG
jgi:hypothetical protein